MMAIGGRVGKRSEGRDKFALGLVIAVVLALIFYVIPLIAYIFIFGPSLTNSHEKWGQFGDFIGGFLNPLYALLAFLAVLLSLSIQRSDFNREMNYLSTSSYKEDIYRIIMGINEEIDKVLEINVGGALTIRTMAYEANRQKNIKPKEKPYIDFITHARDPGQYIGAHHSRLKQLIKELHHHLTVYDELTGESPKPIVEYFTRKTADLIQMIEDVGGVEASTIAFFKNRGRPLSER
jgi:hypothetical protein